MLEYERIQIVEYCRKMITRHLTTGTGGNISIFNRDKKLLAISPSGVDYDKLKSEDVVVMDLEGNIADGVLKPSSEYPMHSTLYKNREDINAVVHTHSKAATTMACMNWTLPAVHYLIGYAKGTVRCTDYEIFGSEKLSLSALDKMQDRYAVLLAHHGLLAGGQDIQYAFDVAEQIEFCCDIYLRCKSVGEPEVLDDMQMEAVLKKFESYGQRNQK